MNGYGDLVTNAVALGLLALTIAKITEAVFGRLYQTVFELYVVPRVWRQRIRSTLFIFSEIMGVLLCWRAQIPFMGTMLAEPDRYIVAGLVVGAGGGLIWDLVLDKPAER